MADSASPGRAGREADSGGGGSAAANLAQGGGAGRAAVLKGFRCQSTFLSDEGFGGERESSCGSQTLICSSGRASDRNYSPGRATNRPARQPPGGRQPPVASKPTDPGPRKSADSGITAVSDR